MDKPFSEALLHKVLALQPSLYTGLRAMIYGDIIENYQAELKSESPFWLHVKCDLFGAGVMNWCKLYGVDKEDPFWKQVTLEHQPFRQELYKATGFGYNEWYSYRREMSHFLSEMLVHPDPHGPFSTLPELAPALAILKLSHHWLHDLAGQMDAATDELKTKDFVEQLEQQGQALIEASMQAGLGIMEL